MELFVDNGRGILSIIMRMRVSDGTIKAGNVGGTLSMMDIKVNIVSNDNCIEIKTHLE